jgi:multiple sugar transport system ATP-binding protein
VNLLDATVKGNTVDLGKFQIDMDTSGAPENAVLAVRPEDVTISTEPIPGSVEFTAYSVLPSGADSTIVAQLGESEIIVKVMGISTIGIDDKIWLTFDPQTLNLYDQESGDLVVPRD